MSDRKKHWDQLYAGKTPQEVSWYQQTPGLSLQLIEGMHLSGEARIIDVGGGSSTLVDGLLAAGYQNLAVLDISRQALDYARTRLADKAASVDWYEADVTEFVAPHPFDVWHDRAVFHFLTAGADRRSYVESLVQSLVPGGQLVIAAFAIGGPTRCSGLEIVQYDRNKLMRELGEPFRFLEQLQEDHVTPAGKLQSFNYFRFQKK